jgi:MFS family permease
MLGIEALPAIVYFLALFSVPNSPRWLMSKGNVSRATAVLHKFISIEETSEEISAIQKALSDVKGAKKTPISELFKPAMRLVLTIGIVVSVLQQITGINAVFFYAPMIFEQSGIGTNASFIQAVLVGITNLLFTVIAMALIDRIGRKPLLVAGVSGIVLFMALLSYGFSSATYTLGNNQVASLDVAVQENIGPLIDVQFTNDVAYKSALQEVLGMEQAKMHESELIKAAIHMNPTLILVGIIGFVACFAVSLGPVMWVLFSELFPLKIRGIAISFVGFINSGVSALVQFVFPWELSSLGSAATFMIYGVFAFIGLVCIVRLLPETKGKSLEELEIELVK